MKLAVFAYSRSGCQTARRVCSCFPEAVCERYTAERFSEYLRADFRPLEKPSQSFYGTLFAEKDVLVFVGACGIAVREIAPFVQSKCSDPAVLCVDELGTQVIPLLSGHIGGANALAKRLSDALGAVPVITTATDLHHRFSVDSWAAAQGFSLDCMQTAKKISAAVLEREVPLFSDFPVSGAVPNGVRIRSGKEENRCEAGKKEALGICITARKKAPFLETLRVIPKVLHLGIGCRRGTSAETIGQTVKEVLEEAGLDPRAVARIASIDLKAGEAGLLQYAKENNFPLCFYPAEELKRCEGEFTSSCFVEQVTGVDNVCERAACMEAERLIVKKKTKNGVAVAVAEKPVSISFEESGRFSKPEIIPKTGSVRVVGIGPGNYENMTMKADRALRNAEVILGYSVYIDLIQNWYPEKEFRTTPMTQEVKRCQMALDLAREGKQVAMVCSGDSGIYGMASLLYELRGERPHSENKENGFPAIEVIAGLTAASSGAALLGAPLTHDFAVISLSDRLTGWETIKKRLELAAQADFSIVLYNPASKGRPDQVKKACDCLLRYLPADRLCGVARRIGREGESWQLYSLAELRETELDMFCTVFIGNRETRRIAGQMVTPRGYRRKE